jgi:hypothetical protein
LLLESARTLRGKRSDLALVGAYELVATAALTGGRPSEVLGLTAEDLSFDRAVVTFRLNEHRTLKTDAPQQPKVDPETVTQPSSQTPPSRPE